MCCWDAWCSSGWIDWLVDEVDIVPLRLANDVWQKNLKNDGGGKLEFFFCLVLEHEITNGFSIMVTWKVQICRRKQDSIWFRRSSEKLGGRTGCDVLPLSVRMCAHCALAFHSGIPHAQYSQDRLQIQPFQDQVRARLDLYTCAN